MTSSPLTETFPDLSRLFKPRTVAVVGATDDEDRQTTYAWRQVLVWARCSGATITPVHPRRSAVDGIETVRRVGNLPPVDVVVVLSSDPVAVTAEAAAAEAGFVVVFASGFAETGGEGQDRQDDLIRAVAGTTTRLVGPNTNLNMFAPLNHSLPGKGIAVLTQSGHQGRPLYLLQQSGVRVTHWAPTGNEADIDGADLVGWFATQPDVGAIAAYLEGIGDGRRFIAAAEAARDAGIPVVAIKVGRTERGAASASSHTGALTGSDKVIDGAFRSAGVIRVDDLDDLADTATFLARAPRPAAPGAAVYAMSGGACSLLADQLTAAGVDLPRLQAATTSILAGLIAPDLPVTNPVDCGGPPMADKRGRQILEALADDPGIGLVVAALSGPVPTFSDRLVDDMLATAGAHPDVAFALVWGSPQIHDDDLERAITSSNVSVFRSGRAAAVAVSAWLNWNRCRDEIALDPTERKPEDPTLSELDWPTFAESSEWRSRALLVAAGVPVAPAMRVRTGSEAASALQALGGPAVAKADVAGLAHRAQHGLVRTNIQGPAAASLTISALLAEAESLAAGRVLGAVVARQVTAGDEVLVGAVWDDSFGPVVTVGHGGVLTELVGATATRLAPLTSRAADRLLRDVPGSARWEAWGPATWEKLRDVVVAVGDLAVAAGQDLGAVECNPVSVGPDGVVALDTWAYSVAR